VKRLDWQVSCGGACDRASDRLQNTFSVHRSGSPRPDWSRSMTSVYLNCGQVSPSTKRQALRAQIVACEGLLMGWSGRAPANLLATHGRTIHRVKLRKPRYEQMFSAVPPMADIAGCDRGTRSRIIEKHSAIRRIDRLWNGRCTATFSPAINQRRTGEPRAAPRDTAGESVT
jgi:hypothetical protein